MPRFPSHEISLGMHQGNDSFGGRRCFVARDLSRFTFRITNAEGACSCLSVEKCSEEPKRRGEKHADFDASPLVGDSSESGAAYQERGQSAHDRKSRLSSRTSSFRTCQASGVVVPDEFDRSVAAETRNAVWRHPLGAGPPRHDHAYRPFRSYGNWPVARGETPQAHTSCHSTRCHRANRTAERPVYACFVDVSESGHG